MKFLNYIFKIIAFVFTVSSFGQEEYSPSTKDPYGKINPKAPEQLNDYKELIGTCDCISMQRNAAGKFTDTVQSVWRFKYIMNGMAIQDETFKSDKKHTSSIRQFNIDSLQWYVTFFSSNGASASPQIWNGYERKGDSLILKSSQKAPKGMDGFSKLSFYDISDNGFKWLGEWEHILGQYKFPFWKIECIKRKDLNFMVGTWKVMDKENYEVWSIDGFGSYSGYSYKIKDGMKLTTETLSIKTTDGKIVYEAKIKNQNQGKSILFWLNTETSKSIISFENLKHDFPKKIQYERITNNEILVKVIGAGDKGFSYKLVKEN